MSASDTTGRLLVATPQIEEGVFRRSVVLMLHHGSEGAQGVVLTQPIHAGVEAVLPQWCEDAGETLYQGGPVGLDTALGLAMLDGDADEPEGVRRLFGRIALVDLDTPPAAVRSEVRAMRIFVGYSGWSAGQLEDEIRTGSWYVVERQAGEAFTGRPEELWRAVLRRQGDDRRLVAWFPDDPDLN